MEGKIGHMGSDDIGNTVTDNEDDIALHLHRQGRLIGMDGYVCFLRK